MPCIRVSAPIIGTRRVQYLKKTQICLIMSKNVYTTTGTSQNFTILAQKCPIKLEYMCRLSAVHHMVRQHYPQHIIDIYMLAVRNISGLRCSPTSQLHFKICPFLAKNGQIMPKKKATL